MGAYANPETYVDTQSGRAYQNMFESIANTASSYADRRRKELDEKKRTLEANQLEVDKANLQMYNQLDKNAAVNQSVDWHEAYDPFVKEYGDINASLLNGTVNDRPAALKRLSQIKSAVDVSLNTVTSQISTYESFDKGIKKIGLPGGVSTVGNDLNTINGYNVFTGKSKGKVHIVVDKENPTTQSFIVEGNVGGTPFKTSFDSTQVNNAADGNGIINYNYNTFDQDNAIKIQNGIYNSKLDKDKKPTGVPDIISDAYLGNETRELAKQQEAGKKTYIVTRETNIPAITEVLKPAIYIQADGLLADKRAAAGTFHDVFKGPTDIDITPISLLENKHGEQDIFKKAYLDYVVRTVPKSQPVMKDDGNIATIEEAIPKPLKATKSTKGATPTGTQRNQVDFNARVKDVIATGEVGITKIVYTNVFVNLMF